MKYSVLVKVPVLLAAGLLLAQLQLGVSKAQQSAPPANQQVILKELQDFTREGWNCRLGPDFAFFHPGAPEKFPEIWMPPVKAVKDWNYEIGGPWTDKAGDFSSTQGQILYCPDEIGTDGVDRVTILEWTNNTFSERPQPPWNTGSHPDPASIDWDKVVHGHAGTPLAMARGMAGWSNCGVALFPSGLVATAGTVTGYGSNPTFQFPKNKLPTAISVTNKSEFAFVTVVDTDLMKGQVAVLALQSGGPKRDFPHEWPDAYPGLPNVAVFTGIKLLGYIDLPGITFPTGISAVGNATTPRLNGRDGNAGMLREYNLAQAADRNVFWQGTNSQYSSTLGYAVVISKYDAKVAFLDLRPLFQRVREMYFTTEDNFQKTRELGPDPTQWPYTFDIDPTWEPKIVKVLSQVEPTAALASLDGARTPRAFVASLDGKVQIYDVGALAADGPSLAPIRNTGFVQVGRNPVCLAYQKGSFDTFIAVSRGDREIAWVKANEEGAQVIERLRDSRLQDPVYVETADTHGIETPLLTVADFNGRQILNYRYGELVFATQGGARFGMGADGKAIFECGGTMTFPGCPFCISAANVN